MRRMLLLPRRPLLSGTRESEIFQDACLRIAEKTDCMFAGLFLFQWALAIFFALFWSPRTWNGNESALHPHVIVALVLGGLLAVYPAFLNLSHPGRAINRVVGTFAQIGFSTLLIHVSGGRIETHFHIFGSLAFLAFYRDTRILLLATLITALDHVIRGVYWPESVYGVLSATPWRALEHALWVLFEDAFLYFSIRLGLSELGTIAFERTQLENALSGTEQQVKDRTAELVSSQEKVLEQQQALLASSKMSALGEMAAGVAHEVNNPMTIIQHLASQMAEVIGEGELDSIWLKQTALEIESTAIRVAQITLGLKSFSSASGQVDFSPIQPSGLIHQAVRFCEGRLKEKKLKVDFMAADSDIEILGRSAEFIQVLVNLLNNSIDAVEGIGAGWVRIELTGNDSEVKIRFTDNGRGVPEILRQKIFQPFFTTKSVGAGTGLGLSLALGIVKSHGGDLTFDPEDVDTCFLITLPRYYQSKVSDQGKAA